MAKRGEDAKIEVSTSGETLLLLHFFLTSWHPSEAATALLLESLPTGEMESVRFLKVH